MRVFAVFIALCLGVVAHTHSVFAKNNLVTSDVPLTDPAYAHLELLIASRLIPPPIVGSRILTRLEIARLIHAAPADRLATDALPAHALEFLQREFADELRAIDDGQVWHAPTLTPLRLATFELSGLRSPRRDGVVDNGLGFWAGRVNPLVANRAGQTMGEGAQATLSTAHSLRFARAALFDVTSRFAGRIAPDGTWHGSARLQEGLFKTGWRNLELAVGRGAVVWGPGLFGGPLFSYNAPPYDMVRAQTPAAFRLPWIFRHIGNLKAQMFFADLGRGYTPAHTIVSGWRLDIQPLSWMTWGINHGMMMGGRGQPGPSPLQAVGEFTGVAGILAPGHAGASSDHKIGVDLVVHVPPWRGLQLYGAYAYEDPDNNMRIQMDQMAVWLGGFSLPRLSDDGRWRIRGEYQRAGIGLYRHSTYTDGWSGRGDALGFAAGGHSNQAYLQLEHHAVNDRTWSARVGVLHRSADQYISIMSGGDRIAIGDVIDRPDEISAQAQLHGSWPLPHGLTVAGTTGYEHVWNTDFAAGAARNNVLGSIALEYRPQWQVRLARGTLQ